MIPELRLDDPSRCPSCSALLPPERGACGRCGLLLTGPLAARLWQVSVEAAALLRTRQDLIAQLRRQPAPAPAPAPAAAAAGAPAGPAVPPPLPAPRPEWSRRKVQNLLLALGVGLLGVAAVIFLAVSWSTLGVGGRSAVMAGVTALAGVGALRTYRAGLTSTAEWLSTLTVGLALLDCAGARSADLAGLGALDGGVYWAGALAAVAALTGLFAVVLPTRVLPLAAAGLGQLPVPLLAAHLVGDVDRPLALSATLLAAQVVAAFAVAAVWPPVPRLREARLVVAGGGGLTLLAAATAAGAAAFGEDGSLVVGTALLVLLAGVLAAAGTWLDQRAPAADGVLPVVDGLAAALLVAAVWAPAYDLVAWRWLPAVLTAAGVALLGAALLVPVRRRTVPAVVALVTGAYPALTAGEPVARTVDLMVQPLHKPWSSSVAAVPVVVDTPAVAVLLAAVALLALGALVLGARYLLAAALPVLAAALVLVPPALGAGYPVTLGCAIAVAAVFLAAGGLLGVRGRPVEGWTSCGTGAVLAVLGASWSLEHDVTTLLALPAVAAALLVGAAAARGPVALRPWRMGLGVSAVLVIVAEAAALARYAGAGWPAVWSLALGLLVAAGVAAAAAISLRTSVEDPFWAPLHSTAVVVSVAAAVADVGVLAGWAGADLAGAGLAAAVAAGAFLAATAVRGDIRRPVRGTVQVVAALASIPALLLSALDGDRLWLALLAMGVGTAVVATTPQRHRLGWVAGLLLAGSSWVRLALADVDAPEPYTVPGGVALLVVGWLRRRRDPAYGSWQAYGSGLSLALVPSLLRAVTDAGDLRPLLLAVAAAGVLAAGAARRLQAPLLLGSGVLALDALVQLAPYLAAAYDAVPRWVTIGALGLLLLAAGATYEQRVRDLRRVGRQVARLG